MGYDDLSKASEGISEHRFKHLTVAPWMVPCIVSITVAC